MLKIIGEENIYNFTSKIFVYLKLLALFSTVEKLFTFSSSVDPDEGKSQQFIT